MHADQKKHLETIAGKCVRFNEPMSWHTRFRTGGLSEIYAEPEGLTDLTALMAFCRQNEMPYLVIGNGSNLLVTDKGIGGMVIALTKGFKAIEAIDQNAKGLRLAVMAGARLQRLCGLAIQNGWAGMNFALGIPGTVGGAVCMNAGTVYGDMGQVVESIEVLLPSGEKQTIDRSHLCFSYRKMESPSFPVSMSVILKVCIKLQTDFPSVIRQQAKQMIQKRRHSQPKGFSAGCFFKNPSAEKPAGWLIERCGLKGKSLGGAKVSEKHANFIINTGNASSDDILKLMALIQHTVYQQFGIELVPEVKIVGK